MTEYKNLIVWKKAINLTTHVYSFTKKFPPEEKFGLVDQMRRSSVSIPSNIAEGSKRSTDKDFKVFLHTSLGSVAELETQGIIAKNLNYIQEPDYLFLINELDEIAKILHTLIKKLSI